MPITAADLRWFKSERMTDEDDGGGRMTSNEIVSGMENQIFDDISDVDRAAGDVSIRKVYAAVSSADDAKYLDAGVVVLKPPADPQVSVTAFSTADHYDERDDLKNKLESGIARGPRYLGYLWGQHIEGQRAIVLWQRESDPLPNVGARLEMALMSSAQSNATVVHNQFLWITAVTEELVERYDGQGLYRVRMVVCELAEPLRENYTGNEPQRTDIGSPLTMLYETRYNHDAVPIVGLRPLAVAAEVGDYAVQVDRLYTPLIPTAFSETALADVNPGGDTANLIAGSDSTISFTTALNCVGPNLSLFLGTGAMPGTLTITQSGTVISDDNGTMRLAGADVGRVDYGNGVCTFNGSCPALGTASKTVVFQPACRPSRVADTEFLPITVENRGLVYVYTLAPIPAPGTLRVAYQVNNQWYVLTEKGGGQLSGADSSYGSGTLNFSTGTVILTCGELPDVDSRILFSWATPISYTQRAGIAGQKLRVSGTLSNPGAIPNSVTISWPTDLSVTDDGAGNLTGDGVGEIDYTTGEWWLEPTTVPLMGTEFTVDYDYGEEMAEETFPGPADGSGNLSFTLAAAPIAGTLRARWNVKEYDAVPQTFSRSAADDGAGGWTGASGSVNYTTGDVVLGVNGSSSYSRPVYEARNICALSGVFGTATDGVCVREFVSGYETASVQLLLSGSVTVKYRKAGASAGGHDVVTLTTVDVDLTPGFGEQITLGSVRFQFGASTYVHTAGSIYRDPSPETGAGSLAGTLDPLTGKVRLTSWTGGGANTVTVQALTTEVGGQPVDRAVWRTPIAPVKTGVQIRYMRLDGTVLTKTVDGSGVLSDGDCYITVDFTRGLVMALFGRWREVADLTPEEMAEPWYAAEYIVNRGGVDSIWQPQMVYAESIIYNAVATVMLPPDSNLLGLDAARLPPTGEALIFRQGMLVLVHHTDSLAKASLTAGEEIDCGRTRLYRVVIEDAAGARLPADLYTVDRELGIVTMADPLDVSSYTAPFAVKHTIADLQRVSATDINGTLSLLRPVSHDYPADESYVSGMLFAGTLQARVSGIFEQSTWTGVWSDSLIGDAPLASFNSAAFPIAVTNAGAYPDRILVKFTSSTAFQVIGENLGLIGIGDINTDCVPINPLTGQAYFEIDYRGWGGGWATGNCLRFNVVGACYPVDVVRAIQPSDPTGLSDCVELLLVGNVDA